MTGVSVYILIGGKSKRFGSSKWKTLINGKSVLDRIWKSCEQFESRSLIGKEKPKGIDKHFVKDILTIQAPIIGLYSALKKTKSEWILLLSCDLPLLEKDVLNRLWSHRNPEDKIIIPRISGELQPTCSFYNKQILSECYNWIKTKQYGLIDFIKCNKYHDVDLTTYSNLFLNMNTKNDITRAEKILRLNSQIKSPI